MAFSPYVFFVGTCRDAMTAYQRIFGGELVLVTAAEMPDAPPDVPGKLIMHASLEIGGQMLMASDDPSATEDGPKVGFNVCVDAADPAEAQRWFDGLADGGEVTMPIAATSWSPAFGMVTDRWGVPWMVSTNPAE